MSRKPHEYQGQEIVVKFDLGRCIHAAECVKGLPAVFEPDRRPWIEPDQADADAVAEVVSRCPTGALTFERLDGGPAEKTPEANQAVAVPNGPMFARGKLSLTLPDGQTLEASRLALCRCGASENKPFCDNRHLAVGFRDDGSLGENRLAPPGAESEDQETAKVRLGTVPDGPVLFEGRLEVRAGTTAQDGADSQVGRKGALCRCGASRNRPYCDGSHVDAGFQAD